ncbi:hypothetical protein H1235_15300 [Pseudoxanthomonas sp. NC8]|nr:hypothetical protein H1235_15300 [Pseudoxanthomonas sp. NC8]
MGGLLHAGCAGVRPGAGAGAGGPAAHRVDHARRRARRYMGVAAGAGWPSVAGNRQRHLHLRRDRLLAGGPTARRALAVGQCHRAAAARSGEVWVGYFSGGASRLRGDRLDHFRPGEQLPDGAVYRLTGDAAGHVWAATTGGLAYWQGDRWHPQGLDDGVPEGPAFWVHADARGDVWVATASQLLRRRHGQPRFEPLPVAIGREAVLAESDGMLWVSDALYGTRRLRGWRNGAGRTGARPNVPRPSAWWWRPTGGCG